MPAQWDFSVPTAYTIADRFTRRYTETGSQRFAKAVIKPFYQLTVAAIESPIVEGTKFAPSWEKCDLSE